MPKDRERGSSGTVVYDDKFYLIGGNRAGHRARTANGETGPVAWVDRFDPRSRSWERLPDAPHARDHFQAVVAGGKIYAAGGGRAQYGAGAGLYGDLEAAVDVFDPSASKWLEPRQDAGRASPADDQRRHRGRGWYAGDRRRSHVGKWQRYSDHLPARSSHR